MKKWLQLYGKHKQSMLGIYNSITHGLFAFGGRNGISKRKVTYIIWVTLSNLTCVGEWFLGDV